MSSQEIFGKNLLVLVVSADADGREIGAPQRRHYGRIVSVTGETVTIEDEAGQTMLFEVKRDALEEAGASDYRRYCAGRPRWRPDLILRQRIELRIGELKG